MAAATKHEAQEQILALAFEGRWSCDEMASRVNLSARTIRRWLDTPEFKRRIAEQRANLAASLHEVAYANKYARIVGLAQMAEHARREYEAHPLLVEVRPSPNGEITNESFNRDAHAAFREALNDIAKELGERANNVKISGTIEHRLVPSAQEAALIDELLTAIEYAPEARASLAQRLLASGE